MPITRLRFFTIRLNTKPSFVLVIPKIQVNASTENSAHSHTVRMKFRLIWFTSLRKTKTSTCFTSRRCGVLITRKLMSGMLACTLTTGRTTGASTNFTFKSPRAVKMELKLNDYRLQRRVRCWQTRSKSHGWKENIFHPENYKMQEC